MPSLTIEQGGQAVAVEIGAALSVATGSPTLSISDGGGTVNISQGTALSVSQQQSTIQLSQDEVTLEIASLAAGSGVSLFDTETALLATSPSDGTIAYARNTDRFWFRQNSGWFLSSTVIYSTEAVLLAASLDDGTVAYAQDTDKFYGRAGEAWAPLGGTVTYATETALLAATPDDGTIGYALDTDRFWFRKNGGWYQRMQVDSSDTVGWKDKGTTLESSADGRLVLKGADPAIVLGLETTSYVSLVRYSNQLHIKNGSQSDFVAAYGDSFNAYRNIAAGLNGNIAQSIGFSNRAKLTSPAVNELILTNNTGLDFSLLILGQKSASFVALKRSGTELQVRTGNDSAYADLRCGGLFPQSKFQAPADVAGDAAGQVRWASVAGALEYYDGSAWHDSGSPKLIYIKATGQSAGDAHLSAASWATSKALIETIRIVTTSADWDLWLLQNDNGFSTDDAVYPKLQIVEAGNGDALIQGPFPYEDEDDSSEVHLYFVDNIGSATYDVYIRGSKYR